MVCPALSPDLLEREFIGGNLKKRFWFGCGIIKVDGALQHY
jgi:hypothetical protein